MLKPLELKPRGGDKNQAVVCADLAMLVQPAVPEAADTPLKWEPAINHRYAKTCRPQTGSYRRLKSEEIVLPRFSYENGIRSGLLTTSPHLGCCHWQHHGATQNATTSNTRPQDGITTREFPAHYFSPLLHDMFGRTIPHRGSLTANTARGPSYWAVSGTNKSTAVAETAKLEESNIARHPYRVAPSYHVCSRAVWRVTSPPRNRDEE
ncbi:hypothetical protein LY76DRAFT_275787 [Colletotrichum caudatum]|nr:hypothetical protein LY76DRAFT_275787 [Colletotrichum caudatum]